MALSCSGSFTISLDNNGKVLFFGCVSSKEPILNIPDSLTEAERKALFSYQRAVKIPVRVTEQPYMIEELKDITCISCGVNHVVVADVNGDVWVFGKNDNGQLGLGLGHLEEVVSNVVKVDSLKDIISVHCGYNYSMCIDSNGRVFSFGCGTDSPEVLGLGLGYEDYFDVKVSIPTMIYTLQNLKITYVACGEDHSMFLSDNGDVYVCGSNRNGKLGLNDEKLEETSTPILNPFLSNIQQISCGHKHSMALSLEGELFVFGDNEYGQIGMNDIKEYIQPIVVPSIPPIISISCGSEHSMILDSSHNVWTCGYNFDGQLGHGDLDEKREFTQIETISDVELIKCGYSHSIIKTSTDIYGFGDNRCRQCNFGSEEHNIISPLAFPSEYSHIIRSPIRYSEVKSARK